MGKGSLDSRVSAMAEVAEVAATVLGEVATAVIEMARERLKNVLKYDRKDREFLGWDYLFILSMKQKLPLSAF